MNAPDEALTPGEVATCLDRAIAIWLADALDGHTDHTRAVQLISACADAALASLLLGQRQAQLDKIQTRETS
ncbi:hypothetical protein [Nocardia sp. CA-290969]|uniref:hypothetical protein n=1 Tax=Nocardia sp. CA-290969 TaxID=3239986 RepID=UPI003D8FE358